MLMFVSVLFGLVFCFNQTEAEAPPHGWSTSCKIIKVVDGDTVDVEIKKTVRIRLLDCWAPESIMVLPTNPTPAELEDAKINKKRGQDSKEHLKLLAEGKTGTVFILGSDNFKDISTLGRLLGHVWVDGDPLSLSQHQVKDGHAFFENPKSSK